MVLICFLTFLFGAIFQAACVGWTHFSQKGQTLPSSLFSIIIATSNVFGLGESIKDWHTAPFFIMGYAVGTFIAVSMKSKKSRRKNDPTRL